MKKDMKNIKEPEKKKDTDSLSVFNCVSISCRPLSRTLSGNNERSENFIRRKRIRRRRWRRGYHFFF